MTKCQICYAPAEVQLEDVTMSLNGHRVLETITILLCRKHFEQYHGSVEAAR